jgi:uncharacterized protein YcgI (DUF1989 family)
VRIGRRWLVSIVSPTTGMIFRMWARLCSIDMNSDQDLVTIPARRGKAARVRAGQTVRVVNTHGDQVVDTRGWAQISPRKPITTRAPR